VGELGPEGNNTRIVFQISKKVVDRLRTSIGVGRTQQHHSVKVPVELNGSGIPLYDLNIAPPVRLDSSSRIDRYLGTDFDSNHFSGETNCFQKVRETASRSATYVEYAAPRLELKRTDRPLPQCSREEQVEIRERADEVNEVAVVRRCELVRIHLDYLFSWLGRANLRFAGMQVVSGRSPHFE
jgi:hypothetical protein